MSDIKGQEDLRWEIVDFRLPNYRGYEPDTIMRSDGVYYGHLFDVVDGVKTLLIFDGGTLEELENDFRIVVDGYLKGRGETSGPDR